MEPIRVLVVEDDPDLNENLVLYLECDGMEAAGLPDGSGLEARLAARPWDVVVLDLGLPGEDGLEIARRLAARPGLGLVILTARDRLEDRLAGWQSGAHVYLIKPTPLAEVSAVVQAVHRRLHPVLDGAWRLYTRRRELHAPGGGAIPLTPREALVLSLLADAPQHAIPRDLQLGQDPGTPLDSMISRLRRKLAAHGDPLRTLYGAGYAFAGRLEKVAE